MDIIYASNDGYAGFLGISMLSLLDNNKDLSRIRVFILAEQISPDNQAKLRQITEQYDREICFIDIERYREKMAFDINTSGYNAITLSRLFLCSYLPSDVHRILYLDCDTIVSGSIAELETISMEGYPVAAVPELNMPVDKKAIIGHARHETYYNAGVLLVNMDLWREEQIEQIFLDYYRSMNGHLLYNDQDIINHCCKGRILTLPYWYNLSTNLYYFHRFMVHKLQPAYDVSDATLFKTKVAQPSVIHYMGDERPWIVGNKNRYRGFYLKYKAMSPFRDLPQIEGQRLYMFCYHTLNLITWICPWFRVAFSKFIGINKYEWAGKK